MPHEQRVPRSMHVTLATTLKGSVGDLFQDKQFRLRFRLQYIFVFLVAAQISNTFSPNGLFKELSFVCSGNLFTS